MRGLECEKIRIDRKWAQAGLLLVRVMHARQNRAMLPGHQVGGPRKDDQRPDWWAQMDFLFHPSNHNEAHIIDNSSMGSPMRASCHARSSKPCNACLPSNLRPGNGKEQQRDWESFYLDWPFHVHSRPHNKTISLAGSTGVTRLQLLCNQITWNLKSPIKIFYEKFVKDLYKLYIFYYQVYKIYSTEQRGLKDTNID